MFFNLDPNSAAAFASSMTHQIPSLIKKLRTISCPYLSTNLTSSENLLSPCPAQTIRSAGHRVGRFENRCSALRQYSGKPRWLRGARSGCRLHDAATRPHNPLSVHDPPQYTALVAPPARGGGGAAVSVPRVSRAWLERLHLRPRPSTEPPAPGPQVLI